MSPPPGTKAGPKCGRPKRDKSKCGQTAGWGTDHPGTGACKLHGGSSPSGRAAAHKEIATAAVQTYGLPVDIDPATALLEEVQRTAGHVAWLRLRIAEIDPALLIAGTRMLRRTIDPLIGVTDVSEAGPAIHVWLDLYLKERRHLVAVCSAAVAAGVAERQVRLAEQAGNALAEGLSWLAQALAAKWSLNDRRTAELHDLTTVMLQALAAGAALPPATT